MRKGEGGRLPLPETSKSDLARLAQETQNICRDGIYVVRNLEGEEIFEIREYIDRAKRDTRLFTQEDLKRLEKEILEKQRVKKENMHVSIVPTTTLGALDAFRGTSQKVACLNFASARNPGGGYASGASAQEESLARASALVPCLEQHRLSFYKKNREAIPPFYGRNQVLLYTPKLPFFRNNAGELVPPLFCDVITCAAPNVRDLPLEAIKKDVPKLREVLTERIRGMILTAAAHDTDVLLLGAWGCGVFRNDPKLIAEIFREELHKPYAHFSEVFFLFPMQKIGDVFRVCANDIVSTPGPC